MRAVRGSEYKKKLVDYLKKNVKKGYTIDSLKWALVSQGYSRAMVDEALVQANQELAAEAPVLREKPEIKYEVLDETPEVKKPWWKRIFGS
jgi:phage tail protein X